MSVALVADAQVTAALRGERHQFGSKPDACAQILRLIWETDGFLGQALYRCKARSQALGLPLLPRLFHRLAILSAGIYIGDQAIVHPGVYIVHGQVVIDGNSVIGRGVVIAPAVTIGSPGPEPGPTIGAGVSLGTGCRVFGPVRIGAKAQIGANAVIVEDVAAGATAVGIPSGGAAGLGWS